MRQNTTRDHDGELSDKQLLALDAILTGVTVTEAAAAVGVHRGTMHRWLADPSFVASLNRRRAENRAAAEARLTSLLSNAISAVEAALDRGDAKTALALLRGLGLLTGHPSPIGPTDPGRVEQEHRIEELFSTFSLASFGATSES